MDERGDAPAATGPEDGATTAPTPDVRTLRQRARDRLRTVDPGLSRARTALRALVAAALAGGTTFGLLTVAGLAATPTPLAAVIALLGVIVVPPGPPRAFAPFAGGMGALAAVLASLAPGPAWGWGLALVATVGGAWLARWGPVGRAAGFVFFLAAVLGQRVGLESSDVVTGAAAVVVGVVAVVVAVRWLVPHHPRRRARRLASDLVAQVSLLLDAAGRLVAEGPGNRRQRRLRSRLVAVQETSTLLAAATDDVATRATGTAHRRAVDDARRAVLDVEALADHLGWAALTVSPDATPSERERLVRTLRDERMRSGRAGGEGTAGQQDDERPLVPRLAGRDDRVGEVVSRLGATVQRLQQATASLPAAPRRRPPWGIEEPTSVRRRVVQAGVAGAVALGLGLLVSPEEWYWSLIGAYIVVTTTTSRGAGLRKATERTLGTAVGVVAGLGAASVLSGRAVLLVAVVVVLAVMVWVFQQSYAVFMFALTIAVALFYEVLGILTPRVLALRLAETALGAAVAAVVVWFVLPVPTRHTVDGAVEALLAALADALDRLADAGTVTAEDVREVDRAVSSLRDQVSPVAGGLPGGGGTGVRAARLLATAVRVRVVALSSATVGHGDLTGDERAALGVVRRRLGLLRDHLAGGGFLPDDPEPFPRGEGELHDVLRAIDDRIAGYGSSRGLTLRHDPGALAAGSPRRRD